MDSFTYGGSARGPRLGRTRIYSALGVLLLAGVAWAAFSVVTLGGRTVVRHTKNVTKQATTAADLQAQANLRLALRTAQTTFLDADSFSSATPGQLSVLEPSLTYVGSTTPSSGPSTVSVQASAAAWGGAALSSSGTCFYIRDVQGQIAYGSGDPCTGDAAMGATGASF